MNKFRITTAIATTALFTFGLAAGSVSASVQEINGQCFDIDGNGYPRPVDCPPDIELPGPIDPFADRCYEETFGGLQIPVPCPDDDEGGTLVPILPGTYIPLPGIITFPWLGGSGDGEDSTETDEAAEEASAAEDEEPATEEDAAADESGDDGSDLVPDVEGVAVDSGVAEEDRSEGTPAEDSPAESPEVETAAVEADDAEDIEISTEISGPAPLAADGSTTVASGAEEVAVRTKNSADRSTSDIPIDEAVGSSELVEGSFEVALADPADVSEAASTGSAVDAVSPEVAVEDAAEQSSSLGLVAAIMLVLLGGGGLAGVGVLATRKRS